MKVVANSLPKSGTHMVGKLLKSLGFEEWKPGLTANLVRETHRNPMRNLQKRRRRPIGSDNGLWIDLDIKENLVSRKWLHAHLNQIPDGSFVTGHLPYSEDLSEFLQIHGFKVIYIIRDPRDVLISAINYQKKWKKNPFYNEFQNMSLDECIAHVFSRASKGRIVDGSLKERVENSIGWLSDTGVFTTTFEALVGPKGGGSTSKQLDTVKGVCEYLELSLKKQRIDMINSWVFDSKSKTFHKGLIGQWKTVLNDKQKEMVNREIGRLLNELGYALF